MIEIIVIIFSFLFSGLFSGMETGSYSINRIKLKRKVLERNIQARRLNELISSPYKFIFMVLIGNNIAIYILSNQVTNIYIQKGFNSSQIIFGFIPWNADIIATLTLIFPVFLFAEILPKNIFRTCADSLMYSLSFLIKVFSMFFTPLTFPLEKFFKFLIKEKGENLSAIFYKVSSNTFKEELNLLKKNEVITKFQVGMIENVIDMHKIPILALKKHFNKVFLVEGDSQIKDVKEIMKINKCSEVFVTKNKEIIGLVSINDFFERKLSDSDSIKKIMKDFLKLESHRSLKAAFYRIKNSTINTAIIIDKNNNYLGSISLDNILTFLFYRK